MMTDRLPICHNSELNCGRVALYCVVRMKPGDRFLPEQFELPDGTTPKSEDRTVCSLCGQDFELDRLHTADWDRGYGEV